MVDDTISDEDGRFGNIPWFFRKSDDFMHHVEVITQLHGEHAEQLGGLMDAATKADGHEPIGEHKFLRLQHGDDLAIGFMAYAQTGVRSDEGEQLVGYAHTLTFGSGTERRVSCEVVVHPECRREGVGRTLMQYVLRHAESEGATRLDLWAYNDSEASRGLVQEFGLKATRRLLHMHRHPGPPPISPRPEGATIRSFAPGKDSRTSGPGRHSPGSVRTTC
jgi:mycothiol synthase